MKCCRKTFHWLYRTPTLYPGKYEMLSKDFSLVISYTNIMPWKIGNVVKRLFIGYIIHQHYTLENMNVVKRLNIGYIVHQHYTLENMKCCQKTFHWLYRTPTLCPGKLEMLSKDFSLVISYTNIIPWKI